MPPWFELCERPMPPVTCWHPQVLPVQPPPLRPLTWTATRWTRRWRRFCSSSDMWPARGTNCVNVWRSLHLEPPSMTAGTVLISCTLLPVLQNKHLQKAQWSCVGTPWIEAFCFVLFKTSTKTSKVEKHVQFCQTRGDHTFNATSLPLCFHEHKVLKLFISLALLSSSHAMF